MLTNLSLNNFKSWEQIKGMRVAPITGLFGTNSSGKTSILQWLLLLKQTVESSDRMQVLDFGDERSGVELGTFQDIVHGHVKPGSIDSKLCFTLPQALKLADPERPKSTVLFESNELSFSCEVSEESSKRPRVRRMEYGFADHQFVYEVKSGSSYKLSVSGPSPFRFKRSLGRKWDLPAPVKCYGFPVQVNSYFQNAGFLADLQLAFEELFSHLFYLGPLREYPRRQYTWGGAQPADMGQRGEKVIDAILSSRERGEKISRGKGKKRLTVEEYAAEWLRELNLIDSFQVKAVTKGSNLYQVHVRRNRQSAPVPITDVGFGISQILPVLVLCYYVPEGSTIVLEQPEIHLHPSVQAGLADVLVDAIQVRGIQIIVESHSEHLLRRLQRRIAEKSLSRDDVALYFCDFDGGRSELRPLHVDLLGNITNWPKDFFGDEVGEMAAMTRAAMQRMQEAGA